MSRRRLGQPRRSRDVELDEDVALEMIREDLLALPGILERFRLEVKLARRVTHPHVARTFDIGEHEGVEPTRVGTGAAENATRCSSSHVKTPSRTTT